MNKYILFIGLPLLLVLATTIISPKLEGIHDLKTARYGLPIAFLTQNQSSLDPEAYPFHSFVLTPNEYPTRFGWSGFIVDWVFFVVLMAYIQTILRRKKP